MRTMSEKSEWVAFASEGGYKVTYSSDEMSISVFVTDAKSIENARRSIILGRDKIKEEMTKKPDHSKVNLPPISITH